MQTEMKTDRWVSARHGDLAEWGPYAGEGLSVHLFLQHHHCSILAFN